MPIDTTDLDTVMRTTFACREWTDEPVADDEIEAIVDLARFAPSGGNRQPNRLVHGQFVFEHQRKRVGKRRHSPRAQQTGC